MAAELTTFEIKQIDPRGPTAQELDGWEFLRDPIDKDIDEGDFVSRGEPMISLRKKQMVRLTYLKPG